MFDKNQEVYISLITGIALILFVSTILLLSVIRFKSKETLHKFEKQSLQSQYQQELLHTQLEIQEQTLKTISQEIHDNIGQVLSLAKLNLNTIDITKQDELLEKIGGSKQLVSKAIQDLRDLSKSLNTDSITSIGLLRAIEYELEMIRKAGEHQALMEITGTVIRLEPQRELIVFRIIQEVLHNIIKHAEAKNIKVQAGYTDNELELIVSDDGKGFDSESMYTPQGIENTTAAGLGLRNMSSRAHLIGAGFVMNSVPGHGTTVKLKIPLNL